jgi:hypothetical protein
MNDRTSRAATPLSYPLSKVHKRSPQIDALCRLLGPAPTDDEKPLGRHGPTRTSFPATQRSKYQGDN